MRRVIALAAATAFAAPLVLAGAASAETWTKFVDGPNGTQWSYDADYTYKDKASGRVVVMQAVSKPEAKLGPSGPGKPDGVGYVYAIDCGKKNLITVAAYKPSVALDIPSGWRAETPKKASGPENEALLAAVCPHAEHVPVR
ncbi:hypothetical protein [Phenylobacterium sp. J367]|uniref:hypothetical protein n=1 Tax=Phenylobacterium sp. J367 TaxID=2898435 RepID=UPI002150D38A|nr:hypothetical protein [Phenylobacterium sp. J367]MCR5877867.1 hypothetical protein [Phenylobacterium sp. J367]